VIGRRVDEEMVAKLARLPWMRDGRMPDWLRIALWNQLPQVQKEKIRAAINVMLDLAEEIQKGQADWREMDRRVQLAIARPKTGFLSKVLSDSARPPGMLAEQLFLDFMHGIQHDPIKSVLEPEAAGGIRRAFDADFARRTMALYVLFGSLSLVLFIEQPTVTGLAGQAAGEIIAIGRRVYTDYSAAVSQDPGYTDYSAPVSQNTGTTSPSGSASTEQPPSGSASTDQPPSGPASTDPNYPRPIATVPFRASTDQPPSNLPGTSPYQGGFAPFPFPNSGFNPIPDPSPSQPPSTPVPFPSPYPPPANPSSSADKASPSGKTRNSASTDQPSADKAPPSGQAKGSVAECRLLNAQIAQLQKSLESLRKQWGTGYGMSQETFDRSNSEYRNVKADLDQKTALRKNKNCPG
jgi:hypothetical protein